ncbi:hypothetical protein ACI78V_14570 [Geodermatophilus sp. SYSU D00742]
MSDHLEAHPGPSRVGVPNPCRRHARGHAPHPAHVQLAHGGLGGHWQPVVVMGAVDDVVTIAAGGELQRHRNHDTGRLAALVEADGAEAFLDTRLGLLFLRSWPRHAGSVFSLQPADQPPVPCRDQQ